MLAVAALGIAAITFMAPEEVIGQRGPGPGGGGGTTTPPPTTTTGISAANVSINIKGINKTMHDGTTIPFWVYCIDGNCPLPSPMLELSPGQQANVNLSMWRIQGAMEATPYQGHTIHFHGLDVAQSEDGVPETGAPVMGDTYTFSVDDRYIGSHMYHCHVHTVKHLEMGMIGAFIVKDGNKINANGETYDNEWNMVFSTVDPAYHTATGDSTVFANYNPKYFLINGNEGLNSSAPSEVFTAVRGQKMIIRLIGIHSVHGNFTIVNGQGQPQSFKVYNVDGFALPAVKTVTSLELSPGQTKDIVITLPTTSGSFFTKMEYKNLRTEQTYQNGTVYSRLDF